MAVRALDRELCWACRCEVSRSIAGLACPKCGPLTVSELFQREYAPVTDEPVLEESA